MLKAQIHLTLPVWIHDAVDTTRRYASDEDKVALAIELSAHNIDAGSGGPFGAAVFDGDDRIVSVGVNRVLPLTCTLAHAENMAYMLAQQRLQRARLNMDEAGNRLGHFTLATSAASSSRTFAFASRSGISPLSTLASSAFCAR